MILLKQRPAGAGVHPHVKPGHRRMSSTDTLISVIDGVCQQDPERWRQFDAIYRPMLFAYLRKQGLKDSDVSDVVQDIFVKLLGKITPTNAKSLASGPGSSAWRTTRSSTRPGAGPARGRPSTDGSPTCSAGPLGQPEDGRDWVRIHREKILAHALETVRAVCSPAWACFEQRLLRDRPGAEIAGDLGIEPNTVFVNACRVLKHVRSSLQEFDEDLSDAFDSSLSRGD